jgi:cell division protein FtsZ
MGTGSSRGDDRAVAAAEMAISSPLLEASIDGAHGVLLSIQGGSDLGLFEINEAAQLVSNSAAVDANIIFGAVIDDALGDEVRVTVIAAGLDEDRTARPSAVDSAASGYGGNGSGRSVFPAGSGSREPGSATPGPGPGNPGHGTLGSGAGNPGPAEGVPPAGNPGPAGAAGPAGPSSAVSSLSPATPDSGLSATALQGNPAAVATAEPFGSDTLLSAPVPGDIAARPADPPIPADAADPAEPRPVPAEAPAMKTFPSSRRRPVVFEEDDDLDVPDFLK